MEPSSVEDGNADSATAFYLFAEPLQWSRPQLRTETLQSPTGSTFRTLASMEPSSVEDGNVPEGRQTAAQAGASMEPSSVEDGNSCRREADHADRQCFNGAVLS